MRLIGVNTLARMIWPTVRVGASGTALVSPRATRSATSALLRPVFGSVVVSVTGRTYCGRRWRLALIERCELVSDRRWLA